jgi:hypothetical protein
MSEIDMQSLGLSHQTRFDIHNVKKIADEGSTGEGGGDREGVRSGKCG